MPSDYRSEVVAEKIDTYNQTCQQQTTPNQAQARDPYPTVASCARQVRPSQQHREACQVIYLSFNEVD